MTILYNWSLCTTGSPYEAPELKVPKLQGKTKGSRQFPDGTHIVTSNLLLVVGNVAFTKSGSRYVLGDIDPEYEKRVPQALERLRRNFSKNEKFRTV